MDTKKLLHPRHRNQDGAVTLGIDYLDIEEALERARAAPPIYRGPMFSPVDVVKLIIYFGEPMQPSQMAAALGINRVTIAGPLRQGVHQGLLERSGSGGHTHYHPTPQGIEEVING